MLETRLRKVAAIIIQKADEGQPADSVLRNELKQQPGVSREEAGQVSRAVFGYFRWLGWVENQSIDAALEEAMELDERFAEYPETFTNEELLEKAIPQWVHECLDVSPKWVRAVQSAPNLWLRARKGTGQALERALGHCEAPYRDLPDAIRYDGKEDLFRSPEFHAGQFELQDISSQAVGFVCAPNPGETWWDACSGEGGKMLHLSELMQNKGLIWATDRAEWRLCKLKQRTARAQVFNYRAALWDGSAKRPMKTQCNGVLVDAPCSGIGTWARNPHARWTVTLDDVRELAEVQRKLLANVVPLIKPGGKLVYSVCTLSRQETTEVATAFQTAFPDFEPTPLTNPLTGKTEGNNQLCLWPQDCGGNGMFIAVWRKKA